MAETANKGKADKPPFPIGTKVWVYKPTRVGSYRLESRWWDSAVIHRQVGERSYEVVWDSDRVQLVHIDDLKLYEEPPHEPTREGEGEEEVQEGGGLGSCGDV